MVSVEKLIGGFVLQFDCHAENSDNEAEAHGGGARRRGGRADYASTVGYDGDAPPVLFAEPVPRGRLRECAFGSWEALEPRLREAILATDERTQSLHGWGPGRGAASVEFMEGGYVVSVPVKPEPPEVVDSSDLKPKDRYIVRCAEVAMRQISRARFERREHVCLDVDAAIGVLKEALATD